MRTFLLILLALAAGFAGSWLAPAKTTITDKKETAYERVSRDRVLRCGYYYRAGYYEQDKATGQLKGLFVDYMHALAEYTGLKIEWTYEVGLGDVPEALRIGKIDAFCSGFGENGKRAWQVAFTEPLAYLQLFVYVKEGDTRFDANPATLNDPAVKFYAVDGESTYFVTKADFPKATIVGMPQMTEHGDLLLGLSGAKVDAMLSDRVAGERFRAYNPGKIRLAGSGKPHRRLPLGIGVANTEPELLNMLSAATREMILSGKMEQILRANEEFPDTYGRNLLAR